MPLTPPPRDSNGEVVAHDHPGILADDGIIRRVPELWVVHEHTGRRRISSMAFRPSSGIHGGMSVDLQKQIEDAGLDARDYVTNPHWIGSIRLFAHEFRSAGCQVGYHPINSNPYHGEVWGSFSRAQQRQLQTAATWFVAIPGVDVI